MPVRGWAGLTYTQIAYVRKLDVPNAAWTDWDISASAPGAKIAVIHVRLGENGQLVGARANGDATDCVVTEGLTPALSGITLIANVSSAGIVELYNSKAVTGASFYLTGYFK